MLKVMIKSGLRSMPVNLRIVFTGNVVNSPDEAVLGKSNDKVATRSSRLASIGNGDYKLFAKHDGPLQMQMVQIYP
jgi:hypothetical protein